MPSENTTTAGIKFSDSARNGLEGTNNANQSACSGGSVKLLLKNEPVSQSGKAKKSNQNKASSKNSMKSKQAAAEKKAGSLFFSTMKSCKFSQFAKS